MVGVGSRVHYLQPRLFRFLGCKDIILTSPSICALNSASSFMNHSWWRQQRFGCSLFADADIILSPQEIGGKNAKFQQLDGETGERACLRKLGVEGV